LIDNPRRHSREPEGCYCDGRGNAGELREIHLKYHLSTADILTASQMQKYAELRGYTNRDDHQKLHHD
jgi:hypothetical protein